VGVTVGAGLSALSGMTTDQFPRGAAGRRDGESERQPAGDQRVTKSTSKRG
jgi:hypothetical protein